MDLTELYATFFEEASELLESMESLLLELDIESPDIEHLNAIFRAAHSIKGGAGTFGFEVLQRTTHIFENILDHLRRGELALRRDIVDLFLEVKDVLNDQLDAYRASVEPDQETFERICKTLKQLAEDEIAGAREVAQPAPALKAEPEKNAATPASDGARRLSISLIGVQEKERNTLRDELKLFGTVLSESGSVERFEVILESTESADNIVAIACFIIEETQIVIRELEPAASVSPPQPAAPEAADPAPVPVSATQLASAAKAAPPAVSAAAKPAASGESSSLRVPVDKVDLIINLVGELVITQSMLNQAVEQLDSTVHQAMVNGIALLQRNARDLQDAVMSIRMVQMESVFSRFPRQVRDLADRLGKKVELVTEGKSTELDKSLVERIIDPLTHLVRNSLDHGIEMPDVREANGKPRAGRLTLAARHQGSNIVIDVIDDGAGLNREKLLNKARSNGMPVSDSMTDDEVWQLIFAPGLSTAEKVSDVSGRGVGMDVVKRNIQQLGGQVQILSRPGQGTTTRIILPLTLAILEGMSIRAGGEVFILPLTAVLESLQPRAEDIYSMAGTDKLLKVRDDYLPLVALHQAFAVPNARTEPTECIAVIVQGEGRRYALLVDDLIGQQQVVVKNLETNYRKVPGASAATILGDGSVSLILDIAQIQVLARTPASDAKSVEQAVSAQERIQA